MLSYRFLYVFIALISGLGFLPKKKLKKNHPGTPLRTEFRRSTILARSGKPLKAIESFNKLLIKNPLKNHDDSTLQVEIYIALSRTYSRKLDMLNKANDVLHQALDFTKDNPKRDVLNDYIYLNLGVNFSNQLKLDEAEVYLKQAASIYRNNKYTKMWVKAASELAENAYSQMKYKEAADLYLQIRDILIKNNKIDGLHKISAKIAFLYGKLGQNKKSKLFFKEATENYYLSKNAKPEDLAQINVNKAIVLIKQKKYAEALKELQAAEKIFGAKSTNIVFNKIKIYLSADKPEKALYYLDKLSTEHFGIGTEQLADIKLPTLLGNPDIYTSLKIIHQYAVLMQAIAVKEDNLNKLRAALEAYSKAEKILSDFRLNLKNINQKLFTYKMRKELFYNAAQTALLIYEKTQNFKYIETAFRFSEKGKSGVIMSVIQDIEKKRIAGIPDSLLKQEKDLARNINDLHKKIAYGENAKEDLANKLTALNAEQSKLEKFIAQKYPRYFDIKYKKKYIGVRELQNKMNRNEIFISYLMPEDKAGKYLISFLASKDTFIHLKTKTDSLFYYDIKTIRNFLLPKNFSPETDTKLALAYKSAAYRLYQKLIAPYKNIIENKTLVIIPDKSLALIPFDVLLSQNISDSEADWRTMPYLIKENPISYAYSASMRFHSFFKRNKKAKKIGIFLPRYQASDTAQIRESERVILRNAGIEFAHIPGAEIESEAIRKITGDAELIAGNDAVERNFVKNAENYSVIHFAAHALINTNHPMYSKLIFSQNKDSEYDNLLNTYELFNLDLNADMVVLSACNTGSGKYEAGEGIFSLARGFKFAGAKSIIMSLWAVDDHAVSRLMPKFYENLYIKKNNKADALRNAKLSYLSESDIAGSHPFFWAAFVSIGNADPVKQQTADTSTKNIKLKNIIIRIVFITSALVLLLFVYKIIRSKKEL